MHTVGKDIVDKNGNKIILKGMGLGGWLVPEGYMLGTWGSPTSIRDRITELIGEDSTHEASIVSYPINRIWDRKDE